MRPALPAAGLPSDAAGLAWHFRARAAAARVERRELGRHITALRRAHYAHVVAQSMPAGVSTSFAAGSGAGEGGAAPVRQLDHAGRAGPFGRCTCVKELELAQQCMAAVQAAEADAAGRAARLATGAAAGGTAARYGLFRLHARLKHRRARLRLFELLVCRMCSCYGSCHLRLRSSPCGLPTGRTVARTLASVAAVLMSCMLCSCRAAVEEGDWRAAVLHAVAAGPGGRVGQRLLDRLSLLPLSHHHRFPIYEQVRV